MTIEKVLGTGTKISLQSLLLGFLIWGFADASRILAQTEPAVVVPPRSQPESSRLLDCPSPYAIPFPLPPGTQLPLVPPLTPFYRIRLPSLPGANPAVQEAYHQTKRLAPIAAAYAKANLPQQEAALIARMQQLVQPATSQGETLLWASLFDAYAEVGEDSQAIAAFNRLESASTLLPPFIEAFTRVPPTPALAKRLPVLETLVNQHLQSDSFTKRQALVTLMALYEQVDLPTKSQAIARQLLAAEPDRLEVGTQPTALAETANIALIAGETERAEGILQRLVALVSASEFRNVRESGTQRDRVLGEKAKLLIEVARQLTQVGESERAVPLLDRASQWLQAKQDLPFYHNSQAKTLITTYAAAKQTPAVVQLLRLLQPSARFQAEVRTEVVEQAIAAGDWEMAVQVVQSLPPQGKEVPETDRSLIEELAQSGELAAAQRLATALPAPDRDRALAAIAARALTAGNLELASEIIQQPSTGTNQPRSDRLLVTKRWLDVAEQLTQLDRPTEAQTALDIAARLLEQPVPPQPKTPDAPTWWELRLMLAERYAGAGQRELANALLDAVRQQVLSTPTLLSSDSPSPFPSLPPFLPSSATRTGVPSLAWQVFYPRLPIFRPQPPVRRNPLVPRPPLPEAAPVPTVKSFEPEPSQSTLQPPPLPVGYDAINRAILSRHYLKVGNVSEAIALFASIPDKYCAFKPQQAEQLLELAITFGQPEAALTFFTASELPEERSDWERELRLEQLVQIAALYTQQGNPEATARVLQQAEAMAGSM
jgi:tetratricopeptide (TPR) repeat protein